MIWVNFLVSATQSSPKSIAAGVALWAGRAGLVNFEFQEIIWSVVTGEVKMEQIVPGKSDESTTNIWRTIIDHLCESAHGFSENKNHRQW